MKVINVCKEDWANFSYDNAMAMCSVGIDAKSLKINPHTFNYENQSEIVGIEEMKQRCMDADVIQFVHSDEYCFNNLMPFLKGKKINVIHAGSVYRNNPKHFNDLFNPHVNKSILALGEFVGQGAKNEVYMVGAIDTDKYTFKDNKPSKPYKFAHYPSNYEVKGTRDIIEMLSAYPEIDFKYITLKVPYNEQLQRMNECDIYIELFKKELGGKVYGSWGITALEAAALGKVVVTMNLSKNVYQNNYGACELITVENEKEFIDNVMMLEKITIDELQSKQLATLEWVRSKHSYKATGEYILKHIL